MTWFLFVSVYFVLSYNTVPVAGQCTVSSCAVSLSGSEESLQLSLDEHDHRLDTMNQNMCSAFEKLEAIVNRTNARGQDELCQDLKTLYYNMSVNLERVSEKIPSKHECHATQDQEDYLSSMNFNLTSMTERIEVRIQAVNESLSSTLQTLNRSLDEKFQAMQVQLQDQYSKLQTVNKNLSEKFQLMQMQLSSLINDSVVALLRELQEKFQTLNETLSSAIDKSNEKLNPKLDHVKESHQSVEFQEHCRYTSIVCDCSDIKANGYTTSGVYRIYVVDQGQRYYVNIFCDMTTTNVAWTVFQKRKDGSVDFYREWNEYANGFGNPNGEFWLGNNFLQSLTSKRRYRLRIDLEDYEGEKRYAEYLTFNISSSADGYRLRLGTYSGTSGDSLSDHNGLRFTTKNNDNDIHSSTNCAFDRRGAWWYTHCGSSNLNGLYLRGNFSANRSFSGYEGIYWYQWHYQWYSLKTTEMKISSS